MGDFCVVSRKGDKDAGQIWIEIDHLEGILFVDKLDGFKRQMLESKIKEIQNNEIKF